MRFFKAGISTEACEIRAALDRSVTGTMTPWVRLFWGADPAFQPAVLAGTEILLHIPSNSRSHPKAV